MFNCLILSLFRYANRAKNIKNQPRINEDPKDALLRKGHHRISLKNLFLWKLLPYITRETACIFTWSRVLTLLSYQYFYTKK